MRAKVRMVLGARRQSPACDRLCCEGSSWYERNNAAVTLKWGSFEVKKPSRNEGNTQAAFKNNVESSRSSSAGVFLNSPYAWSCSKISKIGHPIPSTSSSYFHIFSHTVTECNWVAGINPLFWGQNHKEFWSHVKSPRLDLIMWNIPQIHANSIKFVEILSFAIRFGDKTAEFIEVRMRSSPTLMPWVWPTESAG